ncbi:hypothetical protein ONZ45_g4653 [Pleurotus djamor]|nr:hypothetical protein ONZ45_g4653 [Pleurotus djamor]
MCAARSLRTSLHADLWFGSQVNTRKYPPVQSPIQVVVHIRSRTFLHLGRLDHCLPLLFPPQKSHADKVHGDNHVNDLLVDDATEPRLHGNSLLHQQALRKFTPSNVEHKKRFETRPPM